MRIMEIVAKLQPSNNDMKTKQNITSTILEVTFTMLHRGKKGKQGNRVMTKPHREPSPKLELPHTPTCINGTILFPIIKTQTHYAIVFLRYKSNASIFHCKVINPLNIV